MSKSSVCMMCRSMTIKFYFVNVVKPCYFKIPTMRLKDGDSGSSSFAAISKHVTDNVIRHGASFPLTARTTRYLSARLTAW